MLCSIMLLTGNTPRDENEMRGYVMKHLFGEGNDCSEEDQHETDEGFVARPHHSVCSPRADVNEIADDECVPLDEIDDEQTVPPDCDDADDLPRQRPDRFALSQEGEEVDDYEYDDDTTDAEDDVMMSDVARHDRAPMRSRRPLPARRVAISR
ncbi:MAG: hypothetical protein WAZ14_04035 [Patescibacteria group bacterium]